MNFGLSEEQQQFKESARAFLTKECSTTRVREIMADEQGMPRDLCAEIAKLGWNGLLVPETFGGAGLGMLDMSLLLEECGYSALPGPFLFSSALAGSLLADSESDHLCDRWLGPLAEGRAIGTIAVVEANDSINPADLAATARRTGIKRLQDVCALCPGGRLHNRCRAHWSRTSRLGSFHCRTIAAGRQNPPPNEPRPDPAGVRDEFRFS
jgi:alkylation response protein AidB-like acyl-CoA dehydrogenase